MINFFSETSFELKDKKALEQWIVNVIVDAGFELGELTYVFCDDSYLHRLNMEYLNHDTLTDVISFDYTIGTELGGEIYISEERVRDNAGEFKTEFEEELHRVMVHGVLHFCGYKDKKPEELIRMREAEDKALKMRRL